LLFLNRLAGAEGSVGMGTPTYEPTNIGKASSGSAYVVSNNKQGIPDKALNQL